ncbi:hypothetical protein R3I93_022744 [Phoxinus phoxinus]|uniref:Intestinal mucin-like protein n=1 Tax=Phoxinus phoxinus TaxID=58324 RepID=A0AAN9C4Q7_9TELE
MAKCIKGDVIEIIPLQCPPLKNITCKYNQPQVLVYDEHQCCQQYACDCFCEGWGDPHYITFDGFYYTYQGNCTYILMEEIRPKHHLKIYIDNVYCAIGEPVSCPRSIIVSYNKQVITLRNHRFMGGADLEALKDNVKLKLPYTYNGVRVISSTLDLLLEIPELKVVVTFGITGFGINLPFQHFGKNTQGHCGTCNNNTADDCMIPGGILVNDCAVMADYWTASGVDGKNCTKPPVWNMSTPEPKTHTAKTPTPTTPCQAHPDCYLLKSKLFEACHSHIPPTNYFLACQYDSCHMSNPAVVCASLQSYARACSQLGICIHWRNYTNLCNITCPGNKILLPCGPSEPPTCRDGPMQGNISVLTEGCFCPGNTILFNKESGLCVPKCGCIDPSGTPREFGEHFEYNCEDCICDKASQSVNCKPKKCNDVNPGSCTEPGFMLFNVTNPSDPCCSKQVCNCDVSICPPSDKKCGVGYAPVLELPNGKCCPEIRCEPKTVCVRNNTEYEPGTKIPDEPCVECNCEMDKDPYTQLHIVKCSPKVCPKDICPQGFKYVKKEGECCGTCTQVACIYDAPNNTRHVLQEGEEYKYKCETLNCHQMNGSFVIEKTTKQCPPFNPDDCEPETKHLDKDGCCEICELSNCVLKNNATRLHVNDCTSIEDVEVTSCTGHCNTKSMYSMEENIMKHSCSCCREMSVEKRQVTLKCANSTVIPHHNYIYIKSCTCTPTKCGD